MSKRKAARKGGQSRFVLRIKGLPSDAVQIKSLDNGTMIYADKFGTVYAVRLERAVYRLLQGDV